MKVDRLSSRTRRQLIDAAGEVFAEKGFRNAMVRDICRRAQANVAAVNYHFGHKMGLYESVLRHAQQSAMERYPLDDKPAGEASQQLAVFVETLLRRLLERGRPSWYTKLMIREISDPTTALKTITREYFRPTFERLREIVRPLLGKTTPARLDRCVRSVLGQCLFYRYADPVLRAMNQAPRCTSKGIRDLAGHIAEFSLGGLGRLGTRRISAPRSVRRATPARKIKR